MNKYIFITREGDPFPIADRLKDEGKDVVIGLLEEEKGHKAPKEKLECFHSLYENILDYHEGEDVLDWMEKLKDKDEWFVYFDYGDLWPFSERVLKMGFTKGLFPTEEGYKLEEDRQAGKEFARKHYPFVKVAAVHEFSKVDEAIKFLADGTEEVFVLKSEGSNAETVVPNTDNVELARRQIVGALRSEQKEYERGGFTLEARIKNAIELSPVMLFWNGKPLVSTVELENKTLGCGGIGRLTGGCQNLTLATRFDCPLNKIAFPPIVFDMAKKQVGLGIYDAGLLYDGKDFYFTEFVSQRHGWDGVFSNLAMSADDKHARGASNYFDLLAASQNPLRYKFGAAVRFFQTEPDEDRPDCFQDSYAMDWLDEVSDQLFFYCIRKEKPEDSDEEQFVSVGCRKDLGVATGAGGSMAEAVDMAYRGVEGFAMTGVYYRPKFDFMSRDYFSSIANRYEFLLNSGLL